MTLVPKTTIRLLALQETCEAFKCTQSHFLAPFSRQTLPVNPKNENFGGFSYQATQRRSGSLGRSLWPKFVSLTLLKMQIGGPGNTDGEDDQACDKPLISVYHNREKNWPESRCLGTCISFLTGQLSA